MGRQSNLYGEHGLIASGVAKKYTQRVDGKLALSVRFQDGVVSENGSGCNKRCTTDVAVSTTDICNHRIIR